MNKQRDGKNPDQQQLPSLPKSCFVNTVDKTMSLTFYLTYLTI